jgi:ORF6N domain
MAELTEETTPLELIVAPAIEKRILVVRGRQVMLDEDLADLYGVETKRLIQQVQRNLKRFPEDFMFQLNKAEMEALRSQIATSNDGRGGRRYAPYVFTEQGVAMLSGVLRSDRAITVNIEIMRVFVELRRIASSYAALDKRLEQIERDMGERLDGHDEQLTQIFMALRQLIAPPERQRGRSGSESEKTSSQAGVKAAVRRCRARRGRRRPQPSPRSRPKPGSGEAPADRSATLVGRPYRSQVRTLRFHMRSGQP